MVRRLYTNLQIAVIYGIFKAVKMCGNLSYRSNELRAD